MKHNILSIIFILLTTTAFGEGFVAGTLVKMPARYIPIEEIQVGDLVVCHNFDGNHESQKIIALRRHEASRFIQLCFENDIITCAPDQLFYLAGNSGWCKAHHLKVGDALVDAAGNHAVIKNIQKLDKPQLVYDITVEDYHNFYVSESEVLVHNMMIAIAATPAAPVITGAVVVTAVKAATAVSFVVGCIYSFCWGDNFKNTPPPTGSGSEGNGLCKCGHYCGVGCNCGCSCGCGKNDDGWKKNTVSKKEFFRRAKIAKNYEHYKGQTYRLKKGAIPIVKDAYYLQWDHLHGDVEVWNNREKHVGSLDPKTLQLYKGPVAPRVFNY